MSNHWDGNPDKLMSIISLTIRAVTPNSLQGFYLSCSDRCLGILMQKEDDDLKKKIIEKCKKKK